MARKFLQMGYTRSRRYDNHKSGRKYSNEKRMATEVRLEVTSTRQFMPAAWIKLHRPKKMAKLGI